MLEGKAPLFLIADADQGELLALLTLKCIEDLTKKQFAKRTLRGPAKIDAMKAMSADGTDVVFQSIKSN